MSMDGDLTSSDLDVATILAMAANQMLTNLLPGLVTALLLVYITGEGWAALAWAVAIFAIYSIGSVAALAILFPRN